MFFIWVIFGVLVACSLTAIILGLTVILYSNIDYKMRKGEK